MLLPNEINFNEFLIFRITRTTRVVTTTGSGGITGGADELRESMQKIVDQFMVEDRKGQ